MAITAFVSYSWDSEDHQQWVLCLVNKLRDPGGIEASCDVSFLHTTTVHFHELMSKNIRDNDYVIIVLTPQYAKKADTGEGGVGYETILTMPLLQENKDKLIFITKHSGERKAATPFHLKSYYAIDFSGDNKFDEKFNELLHRIYKVGLYTFVPVSEPPILASKQISLPTGRPIQQVPDTISTPKIIGESEKKRIVWLLPRGFLLFDDIEYDTSVSWAVCAHYYDYDGEWVHSTHYHESYKDDWEENLDIQFNKLGVPIGDHFLLSFPLTIFRSLRSARWGADTLSKTVEGLQKNEEKVLFFDIGEPLVLPSCPQDYVALAQSGPVRDIAADIDRILLNRPVSFLPGSSSSVDDTRLQSLRRRAALAMNDYLGKNHHGMTFFNEVIQKYKDDMDGNRQYKWLQELESTIEDLLTVKRT